MSAVILEVKQLLLPGYDPAPQTLNVPVGATLALFIWGGIAFVPPLNLASIDSSFAVWAPENRLDVASDITGAALPGVGIAWAPVHTRGRNKTINIGWTSTPAWGPIGILVFLKGVNTTTPVRHFAVDRKAANTTPAEVVLTSQAGDSVLAVEISTYSDTGIVPAPVTGWTTAPGGLITDTNHMAARVRRLTADAVGATTVTSESVVTSAPIVAAIALIPGADPVQQYGLKVYDELGQVSVGPDDLLCRFHAITTIANIAPGTEVFYSVPGYALDGRWFVFSESLSRYTNIIEQTDGIRVLNMANSENSGSVTLIVFRA